MRKLNVFAHVPKCAGFALTQSLIGQFGPRAVKHENDRIFKPSSEINMDPDGFLRRAKATIAAEPPDATFVCGHLYIRKYEDVADCFRFTMLRHPIDRLVSHYYYWKNEDKNDNELRRYLIREELDLIAFARLPFMRYFYTRMFFRDVDMRWFDFIAFQERFDEGLRELSGLLDVNLIGARQNTNPFAAYAPSTTT